MFNHTKSARVSFHLLSALTIILSVGLYLRVIDVARPIDGSVALRSTLWRELDVGAIARNFYREDNNILYPRVDWRENTPGYVESEFPLYPWIIAQAYHVFGYHEQIARMFSLLISLLTLLTLSRLAFRLFTERGALVMTAFLAVNPLLIYLSTAVQSDTLMLLFLSLAVFYYLRNYTTSANTAINSRDFLISAGFISLAILCKATAAPYAIFFALDTIRRNGWKIVLTDKTTYIAIALIVAPNLAWILHSRQFWEVYNLSLGVSNESHLIGSDMIFNVAYYRGFINSTVSYITSYPGAVAMVVGLWAIRNSKLANPIFVLGISLAGFYFSILFTTGASWAFYYHSLSIPFVGLLFGAFASETAPTLNQIKNWRMMSLAIIAPALVGLGIGLALGFSLLLSGALGIATTLLAITLLAYPTTKRNFSLKPSTFTHNFVMAVTAIVLMALCSRSFRIVPQKESFQDWKSCATTFAQQTPPNSRLAVWGASSSHSSLDRIVAYNTPWMFFWMDRKGFCIPEELQSIKSVDSVALLGADYYIEFLPGANRTPGFHQALRDNYIMVDSCGAHVLYSLE